MKKKTKPMERSTREPLPLRQAPRCLARTRSGTPCQKPVAKGKKRCRLHGGAEGSGAPCGERNGSYRHGLFTREAIAERKALQALIRGFREDARGALSALDATPGAKPSGGGGRVCDGAGRGSSAPFGRRKSRRAGLRQR